jgi:hypothetical protein
LLKSLTNWNELYFRLVSSDFNDERWTAANFAKQPVADVKAALKYLEKHDIAKHNINSIAIAKLGTMVAGMINGKKSQVKPTDFLPFDAKFIEKEQGITPQSIAVLHRLLKTKKMDGRVVGMLADEIKTASMREQA